MDKRDKRKTGPKAAASTFKKERAPKNAPHPVPEPAAAELERKPKANRRKPKEEPAIDQVNVVPENPKEVRPPTVAAKQEVPPNQGPDDAKRASMRKKTPLQRMVLNRPAYVHPSIVEEFRTNFPLINWKEDMRHNPHSPSAAWRLAAIRTVIEMNMNDMEKYTIQHFYPSGREMNFSDFKGDVTIKDVRPPKLQLLAGDAKVCDLPAENEGDLALLVDIYRLGNEELNVKNLAKILETPRPVAWIGRLHRGEAGVSMNEVWFKKEGWVHSKPPGEDFWPRHPAVELTRENGKKVTFPDGNDYVACVAELRAFGPFHYIHVSWAPYDPTRIPMDSTPMVLGDVRKLHIPYKLGWIQWWRRGIHNAGNNRAWPIGPDKRAVLVFMPALPALCTVAFRIGHGANMDSVVNSVRAEMARRREWADFITDYPELSTRITKDTASYVMFGERHHDVDCFNADRTGTGHSDELLSTLRQTTYYGIPEWENLMWYAKRIFGMVIIWALLFLLLGVFHPSNHDGVRTVATGPTKAFRNGVAIGIAPTPSVYNHTQPHAWKFSEGNFSNSSTIYGENNTPFAPPSQGGTTKHASSVSMEEVINTPHHQMPAILLNQSTITIFEVFGLFAFVTLALMLRLTLRYRKTMRRAFEKVWRLNPLAMRGSGVTAFDEIYEPLLGVEPQFDLSDELRAPLTVYIAGIETPIAFDNLPPSDVLGNPMHALAITTDVLHPPAATLRSTVAALSSRNFKERHLPTPDETKALWVATTVLAVESGVFPDFAELTVTSQEVESSRSGANRAAWRRSVADFYTQGKQTKRGLPTNTVSLKRNETLPLQIQGDSIAVKPRVISTVSPNDHAWTVPIATSLKKVLAAHWKENSFELGLGTPIKFYYGAALSNRELDELVDTIIGRQEIAVVVAGDDSIIFRHGVWYTADYSAYDSTQTTSSLVHASKLWMSKMGAPEEFQQFFHQVYDQKFSIRDKKGNWKVSGKMPLQFATGLAITTLNNTVTNALALLAALLEMNTSQAPETFVLDFTLRSLGLIPKINRYETPAGVDFLKGIFMPTINGEYSWHRLPSSVLKLGKTLKDPHLIVNKALRLPKDKRLSKAECAKIAAHSIAQGMNHADRNCPFLGPVLKMYDTLRLPDVNGGQPKTIEMSALVENLEYTKLSVKNRPVAAGAWDDLMHNRYDISPTESQSFAALVEAATEADVFPVLFTHPATEKLLAIDYA